MGRTHRIDFPYAYHHVMNRAGAKRWVFHKDEHRQAFFESLEHVVKMDGTEVHAYCLMGNHFHLLIRSPRGNLSEAMQRLCSMFTRKFNRIEGIDGPLFRGRFKSRVVYQDAYLRELCRYIHRNPVEANMVRHPSDFAWSSYHFYAGIKEPPGWLSCQELPNYFPGPAHLLSMREFIEADNETYAIMKELDVQEDFLGFNVETCSTANKCLHSPTRMVGNEKPLISVSLQVVLECVGKYFGIEPDELLVFQHARSNNARELSIFLARHHTRVKVKDLANAFSIGRTAVSAAISRMGQRIKRNAELQHDLSAIKDLILKEQGILNTR